MNNTNRLIRITFCVIALLITFALPSIAAPTIGMSFPPVKDTAQRNFTIEQLSSLGITHIRFAENWKNREPRHGEFSWGPLESRINSMHEGGFKILLTIQSDGPSWACASRNAKSCVFTDWQNIEPYLTELLNRFGDKLDAIQFGNEWDHQFHGTAQQYLSYQNNFYALVKQIRPNLKVVLGGITSRSMLFKTICIDTISLDTSQMQINTNQDINELLQRNICTRNHAQYSADRRDVQMVLANAQYDIADIHLYDIPQFWPDFVRDFTQMTSKSIYITEFGGPNPEIEPSDPHYQALRLKQYLSVISRLPVSRAYYFKLTDSQTSYHGRSGLFDLQGNPKPALQIFKNR